MESTCWQFVCLGLSDVHLCFICLYCTVSTMLLIKLSWLLVSVSIYQSEHNFSKQNPLQCKLVCLLLLVWLNNDSQKKKQDTLIMIRPRSIWAQCAQYCIDSWILTLVTGTGISSNKPFSKSAEWIWSPDSYNKWPCGVLSEPYSLNKAFYWGFCYENKSLLS